MQAGVLKNKTKTEKIARNVAFYLHIKEYTKREHKIKYRRKKKGKKNTRKENYILFVSSR